jgi:hypothetical protein
MDEKANPIDVEQYLLKTNFPASKNELVSFAKGHDAPELIISALKTIPERRYNNAADAARETYFPDIELLRGRDSCED